MGGKGLGLYVARNPDFCYGETVACCCISQISFPAIPVVWLGDLKYFAPVFGTEGS